MSPKYATPKFDGTNYKRWKQLVTLWEKVTDIEAKNRGAALILNMSGSAQDIALAVDPEKVEVKDVLTLMDSVYVEDNDLSMKCDAFDRLLRKRDQNMREFIHVYDQKLTELKAAGVVFPDIVLANKILRAANLLPNHYLIARSSCKEMTLANAKEALLRITEKCLGNSGNRNTSDHTDMIQVKEEPVDYDQLPTMYSETEFGVHNTYYGHEMDDNEVFYQNGARNRRLNPQKSFPNKQLQCYGCGERNHWIRDCPNKNKNPDRKCYGCGDNTHWIKDCPHLRDLQALVRHHSSRNNGSKNYNGKYGNSNQKTYFTDSEETSVLPNSDSSVHFSEGEIISGETKQVFFQSDVGNEVEDILLVGETVNKAVLDSGASKTVCGDEWYKCYLESLDEDTKKSLQEYSSNTVFRFGIGKLKAVKMVHLPVQLCEKMIKLEVHVVETDIPLLLSLQTMKGLGMQIDFEQDKVAINGKHFDLETTSSGHYALSLTENMDKCPQVYVNTVSKCVSESNLDVKKKALKLHKRFAHASSQRIVKLLKNAGKSDANLERELEVIQSSCDFCLKHQRASPRPTVCLPLANEFNELIAMDLKKIKGRWVLHCIDYLTRFSTAHVVDSKDPDEIIEKFFMIWISIFGPPQRILSDNGGEFQGEKWEPVCAAFNIIHKSTAAEAPFSNGVCERHNLLIGEMTEKIIEDVGCSLPTALMWAAHAKNSLINIYGFSPYQLVFGKNPHIPGNSSNKLPALTSETSSQVVADHLNSLRYARHAYIRAENSDRIARALRGRIYEGTYKRFCTGDTVYYKRLGNKFWQGPGKVVAQDGTQVLIKANSGRFVKVHPCKLVLKRVADEKLSESPKICKKIDKDIPSAEESEESSSESECENVDDLGKSNAELNENGNDIGNSVTCDTASPVTDKSLNQDIHHPDQNGENNRPRKNKVKSGKESVKAGDKIFYKLNESEEEWTVAKVISRGGKATGALKNYWNVKILRSGAQVGLNLDEIDWIKEDRRGEEVTNITDQISWEVLIQNFDDNTAQDQGHIEAKRKEIEKFKKFGAFEEVKKSDYQGHEPISCRWVDESKQSRNEMTYKYRLVARGFQETDAPISDSPTAQKSLMRMCIVMCNIHGWKIESLDIRAAFLQSSDLDRIVLMVPPKEFRKDNEVVWRMKKPIYGLNDGARKWFLTMKKKLTDFGCKPLSLDPSVYVYHVKGNLCGFCVLHVDDFLIGGNGTFHRDIINRLSSEFEVSSRKSVNFTYVGWNIDQNKGGIVIDQIEYQSGIKTIEIPASRSNQTDHEANEAEKKSYQQLLGKLQWISSQSRPDIRYSVLECSLMANKPKISDIVRINKVVKKMNKRTMKIHFGIPHCDVKDMKILAFSDAALSNLPDKTSSTRGFVIFLSGHGKVAPLSWCSRKLERVAKTIIYAEGIALGKCLDEAINLKQALLQIMNLDSDEISAQKIIPIIGITDSKSLWDNINSTTQASDLKLRREVASIREQLEMKEVAEIKWTPTQLQLADCLTKGTASPESLIHVLSTGNFNIQL